MDICKIVISKNITDPVIKVTEVLKSLAKGRIDESLLLDVKSKDEIGQMTLALNTSIQGLNKKAAASLVESGKKSRKPDDYNVKQSKIAIGSGGFWGRGFLKGTQTRGRYVPAQHTDFIFTSLGEAFGFVGTFSFLALYLFFLFRLIRIAERQRSTFSRVYAYSVVGIFFFHIAVNICMSIGLFPVVGIPLPLISYGGSSLLTFTALLFILLRLDADRQMVLR